MKKQIAVWIDTQLWSTYRNLCKDQKLHPSEPIRQFVLFTTQNGSPISVVDMMEMIIKERAESVQDYAEILLNWYKKGRTWIQMTDQSETAVEPLLLQMLKEVANRPLRKKIKNALLIRSSKRQDKIPIPKNPQRATVESAKPDTSHRIEQMGKHFKNQDLTPERAQEILTEIHKIRQKLASKEKRS